MRYSSLSIYFLLILNSCGFGNKGIDVSMKNVTDNTIYNISVSVGNDSKVIFDSISPNQTIIKFLDMNEIKQVDGSYTLNYTYPDGEFVDYSFGYYTNGWPNNYLICCSIDDMSTFIKFDNYCD